MSHRIEKQFRNAATTPVIVTVAAHGVPLKPAHEHFMLLVTRCEAHSDRQGG